MQVVNAGKSRTSEDQAVCKEMDLGEGIKYTLFGLFDGHGGNGTSMKVAMELPLIIHQNLQEMLPLIKEAWNKAKGGRESSRIIMICEVFNSPKYLLYVYVNVCQD